MRSRRRKLARRAYRLRVALGFVILAALIGIGVIPARKGMSIRLGAPAPQRSRRKPRRSRR